MTPNERRLLRAFRALSESRQTGLIDYAEFLLGREADLQTESVPSQPLDIPRPESETVVKAIRRLMGTYPMLERNKLLHETSALMAQHAVHKRPAVEVIDELELLFKRQFESQNQANKG
jgi:hypothetical protein